MNDNHFSKTLWELLEQKWPKQTVTHSTPEDSSELKPPIVAVDADGTLWDTDVGEMFFKWIIQHQLVPLPADPWAHYHQLKQQDPSIAYVWLAQILCGHKLDLIINWAEEMTATWPIPVFREQQELIKRLQQKGAFIYVVTASVSWGLIPALKKYFHLESSSVIGVETLIDQAGYVTNIPKQPITYKKGKAEALLTKTRGQKPILAMGNSLGDVQMLELADIAVAIKSPSATGESAQAEAELANYARHKGWFTWPMSRV